MRAMAGRLNAKFNFYNTTWKDRTLTKNVLSGAGSSTDTDVIFLTGMNQKHTGFETEVAFQPIDMFRLDAALSYGIWEYTDDADGTYKNIAQQTSEDYVYSIKGLMVGDMPQTILALGGSVFPVKGLSIQAVYNYYDRHWSDWDPQSRQVDDADDDGEISADELADADRADSWQVPSASKIDLHLTYDLPISLGSVKLQAFAHVFNLTDALFIQDATDNSAYNGFNNDFDDDGVAMTHESSDAEVYLSAPRYMNFGLSVTF